jgi:hypothetical protein
LVDTPAVVVAVLMAGEPVGPGLVFITGIPRAGVSGFEGGPAA